MKEDFCDLSFIGALDHQQHLSPQGLLVIINRWAGDEVNFLLSRPLRRRLCMYLFGDQGKTGGCY